MSTISWNSSRSAPAALAFGGELARELERVFEPLVDVLGWWPASKPKRAGLVVRVDGHDRLDAQRR